MPGCAEDSVKNTPFGALPVATPRPVETYIMTGASRMYIGENSDCRRRLNVHRAADVNSNEFSPNTTSIA
jgi:hypothetical protein